MKLQSAILMTAALALAASSCSSEEDDNGGALEIGVVDDAYSPVAKTITAGQTLTWKWKGTRQHSVTFTGGPTSPTQLSGTFTRTFATAGTYTYQCAVHGTAMAGTVTVTGASGVTTP